MGMRTSKFMAPVLRVGWSAKETRPEVDRLQPIPCNRRLPGRISFVSV